MSMWWLGVLTAVVCAEAVVTCPQHCSCFTDPDGYVSANCSVLALGGVEASPVELLSLQPRLGGYPTRLAPRAFIAFSKAKFLWAVNCSVLSLPSEVFHGLRYVIRIDLSYNKIRHLNGAVFKNLESLTTLKLRANPLELTPWDVVVSDSLQELDLGYCGLRTIPYGTFASVPSLSRLYLDGNELRTFTYNAIPAGLRFLNLARNRISNVPTDVLSAMSFLRKLDLSKNPVNCTCNLLIMQDWFSGQGIILDNGVTCSEPSQYAGMRLSKINENELCTLEEVKRHRRINDIQSYGDSKSHRTQNMIHDPDFQSDQPSGQIFAEVLFHDDGSHGLTHMELTDKHYPPLPSDLSDENNKVGTSKQELTSTEVEHVPPTQMAKTEANETSKEELIHNEFQTHMKDPDSHEEEATEGYALEDFHTTNLDENIPIHSIMPEVGPTTDITNWEHTSIITSEDLKMGNLSLHDDTTLPAKTAHEEMADEGYSPVSNMSELLPEGGEEGSGSDPLEDTSTPLPSNEGASSSPSPFTFPSSLSSEDYHYDANHDYSGEIRPTTEAMTDFMEEGSGEAENETSTIGKDSWMEQEENETTTIIPLSSESDATFSETTSEDYNLSSPHYSSSSESYPTEAPTTEANTTDVPTTDIPLWESSSGYSSTEDSSPPASSSSSAYEFNEMDVTDAPSTSSEPQASSTEEPSTSSEMVFIHDLSSSSSTEAPISSTGSFVPAVHSEGPIRTEPEETTTSPTSMAPIFPSPSSTRAPSEEVEVLRESSNDANSEIVVRPTKEGLEKGDRTEAAQSTLNYVIAGLVVALILLIITAVMCNKASHMRPCASKKKVRLPTDTEANHGTEMQDMLLPKPPENGVKIISHNGLEEELPVLQKDWEEKPEPIETVTARMSILAGPQTPVFIHKTLA